MSASLSCCLCYLSYSLLLTWNSITSCLSESHEKKQLTGGCVCVTFLKRTHTKWSWKGVQVNAHVSSRLSRHPLGTLRPGTVIYSSGRLCGFQHMSLLGHPICCSHALQAARNRLCCPRCCTIRPADRSCFLHSSLSLSGAGLATHSRRETWSSQWETAAWLQQPVCWHWGWWKAEHGRFPKKRSWNGKGGKVKCEREAGKDVCSKKTVMQAGGSSPLAQIDNPVKTV